MSGQGPCMLPHHKERLVKSYENEAEYYSKQLQRLDQIGGEDERAKQLVAELEAKKAAAEGRLKELEHIPVCEPTPVSAPAPVPAPAAPPAAAPVPPSQDAQ